MIALKTNGRISQAIRELQDGFTRGVPLRGADAPVYEGPRGTLLRSGRRSTSSSASGLESIPRWR